MANFNKELYVEVSNVWDLNQKIKEGYELVQPITRSVKNSNPRYVNLNGNILGGSANLSGDFGNSETISHDTWYLLKLTPQAELLYGKE